MEAKYLCHLVVVETKFQGSQNTHAWVSRTGYPWDNTGIALWRHPHLASHLYTQSKRAARLPTRSIYPSYDTCELAPALSWYWMSWKCRKGYRRLHRWCFAWDGPCSVLSECKYQAVDDYSCKARSTGEVCAVTVSCIFHVMKIVRPLTIQCKLWCPLRRYISLSSSQKNGADLGSLWASAHSLLRLISPELESRLSQTWARSASVLLPSPKAEWELYETGRSRAKRAGLIMSYVAQFWSIGYESYRMVRDIVGLPERLCRMR